MTPSTPAETRAAARAVAPRTRRGDDSSTDITRPRYRASSAGAPAELPGAVAGRGRSPKGALRRVGQGARTSSATGPLSTRIQPPVSCARPTRWGTSRRLGARVRRADSSTSATSSARPSPGRARDRARSSAVCDDHRDVPAPTGHGRRAPRLCVGAVRREVDDVQPVRSDDVQDVVDGQPDVTEHDVADAEPVDAGEPRGGQRLPEPGGDPVPTTPRRPPPAPVRRGAHDAARGPQREQAGVQPRDVLVGLGEPVEVRRHAVVREHHVVGPDAQALAADAGAVLDGVGVPRQVGVLAERLSEHAVALDQEEDLVDAVDRDRRRRGRPDHHDPVAHHAGDRAGRRDADRTDQAGARVVLERGGRFLQRDERVQVDVLVDEDDDVVPRAAGAVVERGAGGGEPRRRGCRRGGTRSAGRPASRRGSRRRDRSSGRRGR